MACQTQIVFVRGAARRLQQMILVIGFVGIMTFQAVSYRRLVDGSFNFRWILIRMTRETQSGGSWGDQLDPGHILTHANLVAACASHRNSGVHVLTVGFVRMAFQTL